MRALATRVSLLNHQGADHDTPASRDMPSLLANTHEELHTPHTSRSFPSFTHPHLDAATASMAGGLFEYVASLKVDNRVRKEEIDEGRYSSLEDTVDGGRGSENLKGKDFFVRVGSTREDS